MNAATREKLILMLLPSALLALVWWGWFRPTSRLTAREAAAEKSRATAPGPNAILQERARLSIVKRDLINLTEQKQRYLERWGQLKGAVSQKQNRAQALERLAEVFRGHGLTILHEEPLSNQTDARAPWLDELHRKLNQPVEVTFVELRSSKSASADLNLSASNKESPRAVWEIEFAGAYEGVQAAMQKLQARDLELMPLSLRMEEADPSLKLRRWTLVISL